MILNGITLKYTPFRDSRGETGMSGKLYLAMAPDGTRYLVKSNPMIVANEYVAHNLAKLIGVPTSDAVLIKDGDLVRVGIKYEEDFKLVSMDDFWGNEIQESVDEVHYFDGSKGKWYKAPAIPPAKYPDDDPHLAELMAYMAFRTLIDLEDNPQLAFARGHLISFDYAESFYLTDLTFNGILRGGNLSHPVSLYASHLSLESGFRMATDILRRPRSDFLLEAYLAPVFAFQEADFQLIFDDLDAVFPKMLSSFYRACFDIVKREYQKLEE